MKITTRSISTWQEFIHSEHKLPLIVKKNLSPNFFSDMTIIPGTGNLMLSFAESYSVKQLIESRHHKESKDSFLIAHSYTKFKYENDSLVESIQNESFALDLSSTYKGEFLTECHTKSFSIPFDLIPGPMVDKLKKTPLNQHPLYFTIESLIKSMNNKNTPDNINYKTAAIVNLLSIDNVFDKNDILTDIIIYIRKKIIKGERFNLDTISGDFFMSRRKMQYIFTNNDTTFLNVVKRTKRELGSLGEIQGNRMS